MTPIRRVLGPGSEVVGVLGADLLGVFAERIDFSAHTISFYSTGHAPTAGPQGHRIPLDEGASGFYLKAQVDGKLIRFQIDFLYQDTDIQEDGPFSMLKPLAQLKDIGPTDAVLGQTLRLQSIQFGDLTWRNPVVKHTVVAAPQENFLGLDFYTQFVVTLDLRAKQISLETDPNYKEDLAKWLGTGFKAIPGPDGAPIVGSVTTPSPASEAGLKAGDEILEINGLSTATNSPAQLVATVKRTEGAVVTLKVQRTGEEKPKEFSLKVRKLL